MNKVTLNLNSGKEFAASIVEATNGSCVLATGLNELYTLFAENPTIEDVIADISDNRCPGVGKFLRENGISNVSLDDCFSAECCPELNSLDPLDDEGDRDCRACVYRNVWFYYDILHNLDKGKQLVDAIVDYNQNEDIYRALWILTGNNL